MSFFYSVGISLMSFLNIVGISLISFLVADTQLYKKLCPSVHWSISTSRKKRENEIFGSFLFADMQLYKRLCLLVHPSVGPLVCRSVGMSQKVEERAFCVFLRMLVYMWDIWV